MNSPKRITALLLTAALLMGVTTYGPTPTAEAATQAQLEAQLDSLKDKEKEIKNELSAASSDLSASQRRKELLEQQISNATQQISLLEQQLETTRDSIAKKEKQLKATQKEIKETEKTVSAVRERLGGRLRNVAKTGNVSVLQRLLNTDNYTDYLLKSKVADCFAQKDQETMDQLHEELKALDAKKKKLNQQKKEIEGKEAQLESLKKQSDAKKQELNTLHSAVQSEIRKLQSEVSDYNQELKETRKKIEEADRAIEAMIKATASVGRYDAKMMHWPVPTVRAISSHYGPRWGGMHRGLDIANGPIPIYGQNIVAAADGVVIAVNKSSWYGSGWSYGYGYCVIIDHGIDSQGRTVHTMYAHCSAMYAYEGQKVTGGKTVIAKAGNSGQVTGPHLHFEVRVNGDRVNPYPNYVQPNVN